MLARRVKLMELEYRHALSEISALEQGMTGVLRIGAGPMWVAVILPDVITAFHQQFPKVKVRVTEGAIDSIVPALMAGEIDLACVTLSFPSQPELVKEPLVGVRHALVARARPSARRQGRTVKAEDLARYPWVVLANDSVGTGRIGSYLVANGLEPPQIAIEATSIGMLRVLEASDFLGLFSTGMVDYAKRFGLVAIPHEGTFWEAEAGLAYLRTSRPPRTLESFKSMVRAALVGVNSRLASAGAAAVHTTGVCGRTDYELAASVEARHRLRHTQKPRTCKTGERKGGRTCPA